MKRMLSWLVPKEKKFFEMLVNQAGNATTCANELATFVKDYERLDRRERKARVQSIKDLKNKSDELSQEILDKLDKTYRAPFDKEKTRHMIILLHDIINLITTTASRFIILAIERIDSHTLKLTQIVFNAVSEIDDNVLSLTSLKVTKDHYEKIRSLQVEGNDTLDEALSELFHFYKNSIDIMKYREIYELLNRITNNCKHTADLIRRIEVRHA